MYLHDYQGQWHPVNWSLWLTNLIQGSRILWSQYSIGTFWVSCTILRGFIISPHRYLFARHLRAQRVHWPIWCQRFKGIISQTDCPWNAGRVSAAAARIPPSAVEQGSSATTKRTFSPHQKPIAEIQPPLTPSSRCIHTILHMHTVSLYFQMN